MIINYLNCVLLCNKDVFKIKYHCKIIIFFHNKLLYFRKVCIYINYVIKNS